MKHTGIYTVRNKISRNAKQERSAQKQVGSYKISKLVSQPRDGQRMEAACVRLSPGQIKNRLCSESREWWGPLKREISAVIQTAEVGLHRCRKISEKPKSWRTIVYLWRLKFTSCCTNNNALLRQKEEAKNDCGMSPGFSLHAAWRT